MKHLFLFSISLTVFAINVTAQNVITNDYDSKPITESQTNNSVDNDDEDETIATMNLVYYAESKDKGNGPFYGLSDYILNPNGIGFDFNVYSNWKFSKNTTTLYVVDLGLNYSFKLWKQDNMSLYLTPVIGPQLYWATFADEYDELKSKTTCYVNCFLNARLGLKLGRVLISAGYYYRTHKFKFDKKDGDRGFANFAIGYDL